MINWLKEFTLLTNLVWARREASPPNRRSRRQETALSPPQHPSVGWLKQKGDAGGLALTHWASQIEELQHTNAEQQWELVLQVWKTKRTESKADLFPFVPVGTRWARIQPAWSDNDDMQALFYPLWPREGSFLQSLEARLTFLLKLRKQSCASGAKVQLHNALKCLANPLAPSGHEAQVCRVTAASLHPNVDAGSQQRWWRNCCPRRTPCTCIESGQKTLSIQTYHMQRKRRNPSKDNNPNGCKCSQYWW